MHRIPSHERLDRIFRALGRHTPMLTVEQDLVTAGIDTRASVALVVRPAGDDLDLLLIKRATREGDPWSGHVALPGGHSGAADADARATAERETWEEVGIDLRRGGTLLGRLDDVQPHAGGPKILVSAFVFSVLPGTEAVWNDEVDVAVWASIDQLTAPNAATEYLHAPASGEEMRFPALSCQGHVIWGMTFRIIRQFLEFVDRPTIVGEHARAPH